MKVIIVSDIKGKSKSIIPYGLNLAKFLHSEVDIIHVIDSRSHYGVQSSYADSQTVTLGTKLSHDEIINREKDFAEKALDRLLSKEASRLNYPIKKNIIIKEDMVRESISMAINDEANDIILVNTEADSYIFHSQNEILETFQNFTPRVLLVPPGMEFRELNQVLLITDFDTNVDIERLAARASFLKRFNKLVIDAVNVSNPDDYINNESQSKTWLELVGSSIFNSAVRTKVLSHDDYFGSLNQYILQMKPDLILPFNKKAGFLSVDTQKRLIKHLLDNIKIPILYS